jgi:hypothetical protein
LLLESCFLFLYCRLESLPVSKRSKRWTSLTYFEFVDLALLVVLELTHIFLEPRDFSFRFLLLTFCFRH